MVHSTITSLSQLNKSRWLATILLMTCMSLFMFNHDLKAQCATSPNSGPVAVTINIGPGGTVLLNQGAVAGVLNPVDGGAPPACTAGCTLFFSATSGGPYTADITLSCDGTTPNGPGAYYAIAATGVGPITCGSAEVQVNVSLNDVTPPTITCPADLALNTAAGMCSQSANIPVPTITENCLDNSTLTVTFSNGTAAPQNLPTPIGPYVGAAAISGFLAAPPSVTFYSSVTGTPGQTVVTYNFSDGTNPAVMCSFNVNVTDVEDPVINCVLNQTPGTNMDLCSYTHSGTGWDATAMDNCAVKSITYLSAKDPINRSISFVPRCHDRKINFLRLFSNLSVIFYLPL